MTAAIVGLGVILLSVVVMVVCVVAEIIHYVSSDREPPTR